MLSVSKDENFSKTHNAANDADAAKHELREAAGKAGRKVRTFIDSATNELSHAGETVTTQIRTKPVQSSLIALGVGVVIGALLRR